MVDRVLVPTDGSPLSFAAIEYALGVFPTAEVRLLHVIDPRDVYYSYESKVDRVFDLSGRIDPHELDRIETETTVGSTGREIVTAAEEHDCNEVIMGSHGRAGVVRVLLGSVTEQVARRSHVPVTAFRYRNRDDSNASTAVTRPGAKVLVGIDDASQAQQALSYTFSRFPDASVTALHIIDPYRAWFSGGRPIYSEREYDQIRAAAQALVSDAVTQGENVGVSIEPAVEASESAARGIVQHADTHDIDHIVVGSHGREGIARILLGSTAETVMRRAGVSVTIVR